MRLHDASPETHEDYEALAYLLQGWNLYASGETRRVSWKPEYGMPPVRRWVADIPVPH
jgi:hypothetical protein